MKVALSSAVRMTNCWRAAASMPPCMSGSCLKRSWQRLRRSMSTAAKQFHEEEAIGKTYDFQVARRLLRYLKPYTRLLIPALILTLLLNLLVILQPQFIQWAIDGFILPHTRVALVPLVFREHFLGQFQISVTSFALVYLSVQLA